mgnify:CR=1 FL=1
MGRADAARSEDVVELAACGIYGLDDGLLDVWNDSRFSYANTPLTNGRSDVIEVYVLGTSRKNFVTNYQNTGFYRVVHRLLTSGLDWFREILAELVAFVAACVVRDCRTEPKN